VNLSRNVFESLRSAQNAKPGTNATFLAMASISTVAASSGSGSVTHTKKPPAGVVHVRVVGNDTAIASSIGPLVSEQGSADNNGIE
jgi:hypothetical protein